MEACVAWFKAEVAAVAPRIILVLGATAAQALFGRAFRVTRDLGRLVPSASARHALATMHPSAHLRAPDEQTRDREIRRIVADLRTVTAICT
jgi:uracil-DNA glycosylase family 4